MSPEDQARNQLDNERAERARAAIDARKDARANIASPDDRSAQRLAQLEAQIVQLEAKMKQIAAAEADKAIGRLQFQSGQGIAITGGNGNYTVAVDTSGLSINASCNGGSITISLA